MKTVGMLHVLLLLSGWMYFWAYGSIDPTKQVEMLQAKKYNDIYK